MSSGVNLDIDFSAAIDREELNNRVFSKKPILAILMKLNVLKQPFGIEILFHETKRCAAISCSLNNNHTSPYWSSQKITCLWHYIEHL